MDPPPVGGSYRAQQTPHKTREFGSQNRGRKLPPAAAADYDTRASDGSHRRRAVRGWISLLLLGMAACPLTHAVSASETAFDALTLDAPASGAAPEAVISGSLDARFGPFD